MSRVAVPLGVTAVADALGLSLGVAVGLLEGVSLRLSDRVSGRDIVLADETVSDGGKGRGPTRRHSRRRRTRALTRRRGRAA